MTTRKPNTTEILAAVQRRIAEIADIPNMMRAETNPQCVEVRHLSQGELRGLRAVEEMIMYRRRSLV